MAILVTYLAVLVVLYVDVGFPDSAFLALLVTSLLVAGVGFLDDHGHIPAPYRLLVHLLAAAICVYLLGGLPPVQIGNAVVDLGFTGNLLAIVFLVWFINLFNFMDGIDGIAATEAIFILGAALAIGGGESGHYFRSLQMALVASCAGFLVWNWPPARIFMGDAGSGFLAISLGTLAIISVEMTDLSIWTWLILAGVFVIDATVTLIRRMLRGAKWYAAHRSHAYQRAARRFRSHLRVTLLVAVVNIGWLLPIAWVSVLRPEFAWWLMLVAWFPIVVLAFAWGAGLSDEYP